MDALVFTQAVLATAVVKCAPPFFHKYFRRKVYGAVILRSCEGCPLLYFEYIMTVAAMETNSDCGGWKLSVGLVRGQGYW